MNKYDGLCSIKAERIGNYPFHIVSNFKIIYILKGSIKATRVSGEQIIRKEEIEIVNLNLPVSFEAVESDNLVLFFEIDLNFAKKYCDHIENRVFNCNCNLLFSSTADEGIQKVLKGKLENVYKGYIESISYERMEDSVKEIIQLISKYFDDVKNLFKNIPNSLVHQNRFSRINDYIISNRNKKISLKNIAELEFLSLQHLCKEFNDKLENNFTSILNYYRINYAVKLLITTELSIINIMNMCGYSAPRNFYKQFKKYMRCTPVELRQYVINSAISNELVDINSKEVNVCMDIITQNNRLGSNILEKYIDINFNIKRIISGFHVRTEEENLYIFKHFLINKEELYNSNVFASIILSHWLKYEKINLIFSNTERICNKSQLETICINDYKNSSYMVYWVLNFINRFTAEIVDFGKDYLIGKRDDEILILLNNCPNDNLEQVDILEKDQGQFKSIKYNINFNETNSVYLKIDEKINADNSCYLNILNNKEANIYVNNEKEALAFKYICPQVSIKRIKEGQKRFSTTLEPFSIEFISLIYHRYK